MTAQETSDYRIACNKPIGLFVITLMTEKGTQQRLLDAAISLIWQSSYSHVGVMDICKAADTTKGSFYHFFESKAHLAVEAMQAHWKALKVDLDAIFNPSFSPRDQISAFAKATIDTQKECKVNSEGVMGCAFCTVGMETTAIDPIVRDAISEIIAKETAYFIRLAKEIGEPTFPNQQSAEVGGRAIFAFLQGTLTLARVNNDFSILEEQLENGLLRLAGFTK